jgi:hypothetical protein
MLRRYANATEDHITIEPTTWSAPQRIPHRRKIE